MCREVKRIRVAKEKETRVKEIRIDVVARCFAVFIFAIARAADQLAKKISCHQFL